MNIYTDGRLILGLVAVLILQPFAQLYAATYGEQFPHTRITADLPEKLYRDLHRIITYRIGTLPESNMMTTEIRGYVRPGKVYRFQTGRLVPVVNARKVARMADMAEVPRHSELKGQWTSVTSRTSPEANILGDSGTFF